MISKVFPHFGLMHFFIAFFFMNLKSSEVHIKLYFSFFNDLDRKAMEA
jgi:hypothetical protein